MSWLRKPSLQQQKETELLRQWRRGRLLSRLEGIIPALETAHAVAYLEKLMLTTRPEEVVVVNISGRGDKDITTYART